MNYGSKENSTETLSKQALDLEIKSLLLALNRYKILYEYSILYVYSEFEYDSLNCVEYTHTIVSITIITSKPWRSDSKIVFSIKKNLETYHFHVIHHVNIILNYFVRKSLSEWLSLILIQDSWKVIFGRHMLLKPFGRIASLKANCYHLQLRMIFKVFLVSIWIFFNFKFPFNFNLFNFNFSFNFNFF